MAGAGPLMDLAMLKEYGALKKPEIVLWFYSEQNDLGRDLPREMENPILLNYLREPDFSQGLIDRQKEIDNSLIQVFENQFRKLTPNTKHTLEPDRFLGLENIRGVINNLILRSHGEISWSSLTKLQGLSADFEELNLNLDVYSQILRRAQQLTQSWGG